MTPQTWLNHNLDQGFNQIYVIDNNSSDKTAQILQSYETNTRGKMRYFFRPEQHMQVPHIIGIIEEENLKRDAEWLAICDLDEYFFTVCKGNFRPPCDFISRILM
jgi:glycosyltransferase involved in cell wall biosynthesis